MTEPERSSVPAAGETIPAWALRVRQRSRLGVGLAIAVVGRVYRLAIRLIVVAFFVAVPWAWSVADGTAVLVGRAVTLMAAPFVLPVVYFTWIDPPATFYMLRRRSGPWRSRLCQHWTRLDAMAPAMPLAVLASEDPYFLWHIGFDPIAMLEAHRYNRHDRQPGGRLRGGSTLTQQLAKNLFLPFTQAYMRKIAEAVFTMLMEGLWSKRRILEIYLNVVELGDDVFGVESAAQRFFRCSAAALTTEQAALLAAALPRPRAHRVDAPPPSMRKHQAAILQRMSWCGVELVEPLAGTGRSVYPR